MASFFLDSSSGKRYNVGVRQIEIDGAIYVRPTSETYESLGFVEVQCEEKPDSRFYIFSGPDSTGAYSKTPRDLSELRTSYTEKQKAVAHQALKATDWYVIRELESSVAVPTAIATYRAAVRTVCAANEALITAAADFDAFVALVTAPDQVVEDPNAATIAYIDNPADHLSPLPAPPVL